MISCCRYCEKRGTSPPAQAICEQNGKVLPLLLK